MDLVPLGLAAIDRFAGVINSYVLAWLLGIIGTLMVLYGLYQLVSVTRP